MAKQIMGIDSSAFQKLIDVRRFSNNIDIDGWCKLRERGLDHFNVEPVNISLRVKGDHVGILGNHSIILRRPEHKTKASVISGGSGICDRRGGTICTAS